MPYHGDRPWFKFSFKRLDKPMIKPSCLQSKMPIPYTMDVTMRKFDDTYSSFVDSLVDYLDLLKVKIEFIGFNIHVVDSH